MKSHTIALYNIINCKKNREDYSCLLCLYPNNGTDNPLLVLLLNWLWDVSGTTHLISMSCSIWHWKLTGESCIAGNCFLLKSNCLNLITWKMLWNFWKRLIIDYISSVCYYAFKRKLFRTRKKFKCIKKKLTALYTVLRACGHIHLETWAMHIPNSLTY